MVPKTFPMTDEDLELADMACKIIRCYLDRKGLSAENIITAGRALFVFEQLPKITPNSSSGVRLEYRNDREFISVSFLVSEEEFNANFYDASSTGGGSERIVYAGGDKKGYIESYELGEQIGELYNMGGVVQVEDKTVATGILTYTAAPYHK